MRGFLIAILVLSVVVALALWGVISYRNHVSYNNGMVDARATRVIQVDVGALTRDIGWNAFWNPTYYAEEGSNELMERKKTDKTGLGTVAKVFLFQVEDKPFWSNATFGILPVADAEVFTRFLLAELGMRVDEDSRGRYGRHAHVAIRYDEQQAVVALGNFGQGDEQGNLADSLLMAQLGAYLAGEQLINIKESRFFEAMGQSGHIVSTGNEQVSVDFLEGEIVFSYLSDNLPSLAPTPAPAPGDSSFVRLHGELMSLLPQGKVFAIGDYALHSDSLRHHTAGEVVGEWKGMDTQTDSVVAWSYDENFEMQEVVELVERAVPDFYLSVHAKTDSLLGYLVRHGILDSASATVNPSFFPLFPLFWQQEGEWLTLHTKNGPNRTEEAVSDVPLHVEADIQAIKQYAAIPKIQSYLAPFRSLTIAAEKQPQGTVLRGRIKMEDNTVNSLMQLLVRKQDPS